MKAIFRFFNKLSVMTIASITVLVALLTVMIGFFSYQVFTQTMLKESTTYVKETAESVLHNSMEWDFSDYLKIGAKRMDELASLDQIDLNKMAEDPEVQAFNAYTSTVTRLSRILVSRDFNELKIVIPNPETGYNEYSVVFGQRVTSPEKDIMFILELGTVEKNSTNEQREAMKRIWNNESEEEIFYEYSEDSEIDSMVTLIKGLKIEGEPPTGILIIRRSIENMVQTWNRFVIGITIMGLSMDLIITTIIGL